MTKKNVRGKSKAKSRDKLVKNGTSTDSVIAVVGSTGAGRSTFINKLFEEDVAAVGDGIKSCTNNLMPVIYRHPSDSTRHVVVVDTLGFNNLDVDDDHVINRITNWLISSYTNGMKLAGIIYIYDISQSRTNDRTFRQNLEKLRELTGSGDSFSSIILATTKWSEVTDDDGDRRLNELKNETCKEIIIGSNIYKFEDSYISARTIVGSILEKHVPIYDCVLNQKHNQKNAPKEWKKKSKIAKKGDNLVEDGNPSDTIIAVIGSTGAGKSTFINKLFGEDVTKVGHELDSCTSTLKYVRRPLPFDQEGHLVVVDTPGFDDTYIDDAEVLRRISVWLATSYTKEMKLAGVVYLYDITQARMLGTARKNLATFHKLCGSGALSSVILGITKWPEVSEDTANARLQPLMDVYWKEMIEGGATVVKFDSTPESAKKMVNTLLKKHYLNYDVLKIQEELVDRNKIIPDTDAGKELRYTLEELLKIQKGRATEEQVMRTLSTIQALKVSIPQRLKLIFGL